MSKKDKKKNAYDLKKRMKRNHIFFGIAIILQTLVIPTILINVLNIVQTDTLEVAIDKNILENIKLVTEIEGGGTIYLSLWLVLTIFWITFIYFRPVPSLEYSDEYGSARFTTIDEQKDIFAVEKPTEIEMGGFIIGMTDVEVIKDKKTGKIDYRCAYSEPLFDRDDTHVTLYGTTGAGKTTRVLYPTLYFNALKEDKPSFIITDPKGEIFEKTSGFLKEQGYKIRVINLTNPLSSSRYNPMELVNKHMDVYKANRENELGFESRSLVVKYAQSLAHTIVHQRKRTDEPIWQNGEESLLTGLILYVAEFAPHEQRNLPSVYTVLTQLGQSDEKGSSELSELMKELPPTNLAKQYFSTANIAGDKTKASIFVTAATDLILFADPSIQQLTYQSDHELDEIGTVSTCIYLIVPDQDTTRHFVASLYIDQTYMALVELANTQKGRVLPKQLLVLFDEFGNMPTIKDFNTKISVARSRGIRFMLILQSQDQLIDKYGKETASIILDNCQIQMCIGISSKDTAQVFSDKMGGQTIEVQSGGVSGGVDSASASSNISLAKRELMTADEILNLQKPKAIILKTFSYPSLTDLPPFYVIDYMVEAFEKFPPLSFSSQFKEIGLFIPNIDDVKMAKEFRSWVKELKHQVDRIGLSEDEALVIVSEIKELDKLINKWENAYGELEKTELNEKIYQKNESIRAILFNYNNIESKTQELKTDLKRLELQKERVTLSNQADETIEIKINENNKLIQEIYKRAKKSEQIELHNEVAANNKKIRDLILESVRTEEVEVTTEFERIKDKPVSKEETKINKVKLGNLNLKK